MASAVGTVYIDVTPAENTALREHLKHIRRTRLAAAYSRPAPLSVWIHRGGRRG